ncbi:hypothetical protein RI129_004826 [Pyrocoelia pectoralis]|uniref:Regulatory protein zeste n=1 Tax=Pyrocoelia pectoralis TaxID=417401 RepID=A0AAN7VEN9_9COLE
MSDKKKRSAKTTRQQYCLFIEEVQTNKAFRNNKYNPEKPDVLETTWEELTNNLNSTGGPQHSTKQWKSIFSDWKSSVRKKAREIQVARLETGRGICDKALTDLEQLLLDITGEVVTKGAGFPELGVVPVPANIESK